MKCYTNNYHSGSLEATKLVSDVITAMPQQMRISWCIINRYLPRVHKNREYVKPKVGKGKKGKAIPVTGRGGP
jgi:hypothetical protein